MARRKKSYNDVFNQILRITGPIPDLPLRPASSWQVKAAKIATTYLENLSKAKEAWPTGDDTKLPYSVRAGVAG